MASIGWIDDFLREAAVSSDTVVKDAAKIAAKNAGYSDDVIEATITAAKLAAKDTGSISSSLLVSAADFALAHPYLTTGGVVATGIVGIAAIGATKGAVTGVVTGIEDVWTGLTGGNNPPNPNSQINPYLVYYTGKPVLPVKSTPTTDTTTKKADTGLLGWFTDSFMTGLFGTQQAGTDFMTKAQPWLIGGAVIVGIVAVGYTVKAFKPSRK